MIDGFFNDPRFVWVILTLTTLGDSYMAEVHIFAACIATTVIIMLYIVSDSSTALVPCGGISFY